MFIICIESSHSRGLGHLYRSLTLAEELLHRGAEVLFLVNKHDRSQQILWKRGFSFEIYDISAPPGSWEAEFLRNKQRSKIWINDRLDTRLPHAYAVASTGLKVVTFDDRGDGGAMSDVNIAALVFEHTETLGGKRIYSGVDYLVLNPEIARYRRRREKVQSVLATLGGADTYGVTARVASWLAKTGLHATIVTGPAFQHTTDLDAVLANADGVTISDKNYVSSLIEEMNLHDLAITGGGITPFEAAASGLPCIVIANEDFEIPVGRALEKLGSACFAGHYSKFDLTMIADDLPIAHMSEAALRAIDLNGVIRVADLIWEIAR